MGGGVTRFVVSPIARKGEDRGVGVCDVLCCVLGQCALTIQVIVVAVVVVVVVVAIVVGLGVLLHAAGAEGGEAGDVEAVVGADALQLE